MPLDESHFCVPSRGTLGPQVSKVLDKKSQQKRTGPAKESKAIRKGRSKNKRSKNGRTNAVDIRNKRKRNKTSACQQFCATDEREEEEEEEKGSATHIEPTKKNIPSHGMANNLDGTEKWGKAQFPSRPRVVYEM
ncbi:hypothetical protein ZHAS_00008159 [Anopheles sinensis]|uniref:Uncharacterized protein n=1 Tax=Anopheles sinensis TaxID=74873 RepID=A0A084VRY9_ANOSI|nr:hypothetical protein ZHAS_00008159 [Anopheles sinensis]